MAYLSSRRSSILSSGSGPATGASAAPATASAPASATPAPSPSSGAFTDLSGYLSASGPAAQAYAQKILGGLDSQAASAGQYVSGPVNGAGANPQVLADANAQVEARNANAQAVKSSLDAYGAQGGLSQLLADKSSTGNTPYTPGMASFDSYLLGKSGAQDQLAALRAKWDPILDKQDAFQAPQNIETNGPALKPVTAPSASVPTPKYTQPADSGYEGPGETDPAKAAGKSYTDPTKPPDSSGRWTWSKDAGRWIPVGV